jgi:hypothetical protein
LFDGSRFSPTTRPREIGNSITSVAPSRVSDASTASRCGGCTSIRNMSADSPLRSSRHSPQQVHLEEPHRDDEERAETDREKRDPRLVARPVKTADTLTQDEGRQAPEPSEHAVSAVPARERTTTVPAMPPTKRDASR